MNIALTVWICCGIVSSFMAYMTLKDHKISQPFPLNSNTDWAFIGAILMAFVLGPVPFFMAIADVFGFVSERTVNAKNMILRLHELSRCPSCGTNFIGETKHIYARQIEDVQFIWCENCVPDMVKERNDLSFEKKTPL